MTNLSGNSNCMRGMSFKPIKLIFIGLLLVGCKFLIQAQNQTITAIQPTTDLQKIDLFGESKDTLWYEVTQHFKELRILPDSTYREELITFPIREVIVDQTAVSTIVEWTLYLNQMRVVLIAPDSIEKGIAIGPVQVTFEYSHDGRLMEVLDGRQMPWTNPNRRRLRKQLRDDPDDYFDFMIREYSDLYNEAGHQFEDLIIKQLLHCGYSGFHGLYYNKDEITYNEITDDIGFYVNFWKVHGMKAINYQDTGSWVLYDEVDEEETRAIIKELQQGKRQEGSLSNPNIYLSARELRAQTDSLIKYLNQLKAELMAATDTSIMASADSSNIENEIEESEQLLTFLNQEPEPPKDYFPHKKPVNRYIMVDKQSNRPIKIYAERNQKIPSSVGPRALTTLRTRIIIFERIEGLNKEK